MNTSPFVTVLTCLVSDEDVKVLLLDFVELLPIPIDPIFFLNNQVGESSIQQFLVFKMKSAACRCMNKLSRYLLCT